MSETVRFIVITTPPREVSQHIDEARRLVCGISRSCAALAYPPHVTLRTGMLVPAPMVSDLIDAFEKVIGRWDPFPMQTDGLWITSYRDREKEKYLVGYRMMKGPDLAELNSRLLAYTTWRASSRLSFEPHLTLAFDDLDLDAFVRVQHWLDDNPQVLPKGFSWTCDNVGLYRREGEGWLPYKVWRQ
jgi:2'-5' RNA ligase